MIIAVNVSFIFFWARLYIEPKQIKLQFNQLNLADSNKSHRISRVQWVISVLRYLNRRLLKPTKSSICVEVVVSRGNEKLYENKNIYENKKYFHFVVEKLLIHFINWPIHDQGLAFFSTDGAWCPKWKKVLFIIGRLHLQIKILWARPSEF